MANVFDGFILGVLGLLLKYDVLLHEQNKFFQWTSDKLTYVQNGHIEDCFIIKRESFDNMNFIYSTKCKRVVLYWKFTFTLPRCPL